MSDREDENPADKIKRLIREASAEKPSNVTDFFAEAQKRGRSIVPPTQKTITSKIQIIGNNNAGVMGDGNHIHINVKASPSTRPKINVQPGTEHISDTQAAEVKELVDKTVSATGKNHAFVWSTIKRRYRFTKYQLITHDKYDDIIKYLKKWIASHTVTPLNASANRKRVLARIHAEANKQKGTLEQVYAYIQGRFGTSSLSELTQGQLDEIVRQFKF